MALIKCPECGEKVSDQAEVCIHCGYPLKKNMEKRGEPEPAPAHETESAPAAEPDAAGDDPEQASDEERKKHIRNRIIAVVVVVGCIIVFVAAFEYSNHAYTRAQRRAQQSYSSYQTEKSELDSLKREKAAVDAAIDALESGR